MKRSLLNGTSGPDTSKMLLRLISAHFDHRNRSTAIAKLHSFRVATKTPFADYSRAFGLLIAFVTDNERALAPRIEVVLEVACNSVSEQYPGLMPVPYAGELATASMPFGSIELDVVGVWWTFD